MQKPIIFNLEGPNTEYKQKFIVALNESLLNVENCCFQSESKLQKQLKSIKIAFQKNIDLMSKVFLFFAIQYESFQKLSSDFSGKKIIVSTYVLSELLMDKNFDEWKNIWKTVFNCCKENISDWKIFFLLEGNEYIENFKYLYKEIEDNLFFLSTTNTIEKNIEIVLKEINKN